MTTGKRSEFFSLWYMPEASYGTDPGIVAATDVTGGTGAETYMLQPNATYRAYARLAEKPSGLPKQPLVEVPQVFSTHDFDTCKVLGIKDSGEVTFTFNMHGTVTDYGSTGNTGRTQPPPWLRLAGSALGKLLGNITGQSGGTADTVAGVPTDGDTFPVTTGTVDEGHVIGMNGPGTSVDFEILRPTAVGSATTITASAYYGVTFGFTATPVAAEAVYYACQAAFDKRFEDVSESFTLLLQRPDSAATLLITGARANSWEITTAVGTVPKIKISFIYKNFAYTTDTIDAEPDYYSNVYPCSHVTQGAKLWLVWDNNNDGSIGATERKTDMEIASASIKWNAGYTRRKASTASNGISEVMSTGMSTFEMSFEVLYNHDWQRYLGLCCSDVFGSLAVAYWEPQVNFIRTAASTLRTGAWFCFVTAAHMIEDPGTEGSQDGVMGQTIRLSAGNYSGDTGNFATTTHVDTKFVIGVV